MKFSIYFENQWQVCNQQTAAGNRFCFSFAHLWCSRFFGFKYSIQVILFCLNSNRKRKHWKLTRTLTANWKKKCGFIQINICHLSRYSNKYKCRKFILKQSLIVNGVVICGRFNCWKICISHRFYHFNSLNCLMEIHQISIIIGNYNYGFWLEWVQNNDTISSFSDESRTPKKNALKWRIHIVFRVWMEKKSQFLWLFIERDSPRMTDMAATSVINIYTEILFVCINHWQAIFINGWRVKDFDQRLHSISIVSSIKNKIRRSSKKKNQNRIDDF